MLMVDFILDETISIYPYHQWFLTSFVLFVDIQKYPASLL